MGRPNVNWNVGIAAEKQSTYTSKAVKAGIPFASQITEPNTKYIIKYDFDLDDDFTMPENCILEFDGGSINGGKTITGNDTTLLGDIKCFTTIAGTFTNEYLDITWFGAVGDDNKDNTAIIKNILSICINNKANMYIPKGVFACKSGNHVISFGPAYNPDADPFDIDSYVSGNDITIYGEGKNSVIKSYRNNDVINLYRSKDLYIKNLHIDSGIVEKLDDDWGQNLISMVDVQNIHISGCYLTNGYYKARSEGYLDGGKGITAQGSIFNNVTVEDCEVENCAHGIDIYTDAAFCNTPDSYVYYDNIRVKKCFIGVWAHVNITKNRPTPDTYQRIDSGLITINAKTSNCFKAFDSDSLVGANISIQNVSDQTVEDLSKNGYGNSWFDSLPYSALSKIFRSCWAGRLYTCRNCSISIDSYSKYVNYGFQIIGTYTFNNYQIVSENNIFVLNLNNDATIEQVLGESEITDEEPLLVFQHTEASAGNIMFDKSTFIINGCGNSKENINKFYKLGYTSNNLVIILDGLVFSSSSRLSEVELWHPRNNTFSIIKGGAGILGENRSSNNGVFPTFASVKPSTNEISIAFNGNGDVLKQSITAVQGVDNFGNMIRGGAGIAIRATTYPHSIIGYIPADVNRSKGSTAERPTLDEVNSGYCYFDTRINKPIWWDGTKWVDATGQTV